MNVAGVHEFFIDTKTYYTVATDVWAGKPLKTFSRKELETYRQVGMYATYSTHMNGL